MPNDDTSLALPAQRIPVPRSISPQGQAYLAAAAKRIAEEAASPGDKGSALRKLTESADSALEMLRPMASFFKGTAETLILPSGASLYRVTPDNLQGRLAEVVLFDIHGGGFVSGGGEMCELLAKLRALGYGAQIYSVDYRLAPEHTYPAALEDCMAAYQEVLSAYPASAVVMSGSSAGGNLAAAVMMRAQDEGLPLPAGLLLLTPALDLTESGDSFQTNRFLDVNLIGTAGVATLYSPGQDLTHPYLSPLFGDIGPNWPPTLLMSGTRDMLLSDTVRMHRVLRKAGVAAELHICEASPHGGFMGSGAPEDMDMLAEFQRFIYSVWGV